MSIHCNRRNLSPLIITFATVIIIHKAQDVTRALFPPTRPMNLSRDVFVLSARVYRPTRNSECVISASRGVYRHRPFPSSLLLSLSLLPLGIFSSFTSLRRPMMRTRSCALLFPAASYGPGRAIIVVLTTFTKWRNLLRHYTPLRSCSLRATTTTKTKTTMTTMARASVRVCRRDLR